MCGVCAVYIPGEGRELPSILADKMLATLKHRGPDDAGIWSDDGIALGNRRLAILDLSPTGHQPMVNNIINGVLIEGVLTFNGEIYNHRDLRQRFEGLTEWHGTSDSETVLALLAVENPVWTCQRLRGMFAFAHWNGHRLVIARDRLGIKPIYYAHAYIPESCWFVASEVRAIRAVANCDLDWTSLAAYLRLGHIPSPRTAFVGIHELPPGCVGVIEQDRITLKAYWSLPGADERLSDRAGDVNASRNRVPGPGPGPLPALFHDAVKSHLQSDVPVALFAGGGTDTKAIAKVAADAGAHLELLHILGDQRDSEGAMAICRRYNWPISFDLPKPTTEDLDSFFHRMDQPTVDGVNVWFASRLAAKSGFKVVLSGLGGDELFAGYSTFKTIRYIQALQRVMPQGWGRNYPKFDRFEDAFMGKRTLKTAYGSVRGLFSRAESIALTRGSLQEACRSLDLNDILPDAQDMRTMELSAYMRSQLLRDADTFSMAHSVELRVPFLDTPFLESALDHPMTRKQFCRALGLPAPGRKRGFSLPIGQWLKGPWRSELHGVSALFNPDALRGLDRQHWSRTWALVALGRWWWKNT